MHHHAHHAHRAIMPPMPIMPPCHPCRRPSSRRPSYHRPSSTAHHHRPSFPPSCRRPSSPPIMPPPIMPPPIMPPPIMPIMPPIPSCRRPSYHRPSCRRPCPTHHAAAHHAAPCRRPSATPSCRRCMPPPIMPPACRHPSCRRPSCRRLVPRRNSASWGCPKSFEGAWCAVETQVGKLGPNIGGCAFTSRRVVMGISDAIPRIIVETNNNCNPDRNISFLPYWKTRVSSSTLCLSERWQRTKRSLVSRGADCEMPAGKPFSEEAILI